MDQSFRRKNLTDEILILTQEIQKTYPDAYRSLDQSDQEFDQLSLQDLAEIRNGLQRLLRTLGGVGRNQ